MKTYEFKTEMKNEFLGRYTLSTFSEKTGRSKGNIGNILNGKKRTSDMNAIYLTGVSNELNQKDKNYTYYFKESE